MKSVAHCVQTVELEQVRQFDEQLGTQDPPVSVKPGLQPLHVPGVEQVEQFAEQVGMHRFGSEPGEFCSW